ncbi:MAG TPA: GNAT family N-acetyltransferase [Thermoplasmatales archaeon]|nr:GNAT family N-acetyltransferase [Thermoplasmatales archaeon]
MLREKTREQRIEIASLEEEEFRQNIEELINVYRGAYQGLERYAYTKRRDIKNYLKWLYRSDSEVFLVAKEKDSIIGFTAGDRYWWDKNYGEISELHEFIINKKHQGRGIGRQLLNKMINKLEETHPIIGLWVGEGNSRAIRFYEKQGFKKVGQVGIWIRMIREKS